MPIRADLRALYRGPTWRAVRARIRARAGDRCEQCRVANHTSVIRRGGHWNDMVTGLWYGPDGSETGVPTEGRMRVVWIVCSTAHVNHRPGDDRDENLRYLCQSCHLAFDKEHHRWSRQVRKDLARPLLREAV